MTDIQIAQNAKPLSINELADKIGILPEELEPYGHYKAKVSLKALKRLKNEPDGKLVLVTAINPTPAGEGKTTVTVGLGQAMAKINKNAIIALREPSLGPVFGIKGGAAGGGHSQVIPMEDINLHFTGDIHAITATNNLLCALIDNHLQQGNALGIDQRRILFNRCMDMNDRALRNITIGLGGQINGIPREETFSISSASEIMAILCLANSIDDLKERLGNILVAYSFDNKAIFAKDLGGVGALAALLKEAIKPNLVQTLEQTPALIHGGPFANIAHGCNSVTATKIALKLGDYCITEAGFGADLGAEKFMDIKCRYAGLAPSAVVLVATIRALKYNGGIKTTELVKENVEALKKGMVNLGAHIENLKKFGVPVVVAINKFKSDTQAEIDALMDYCKALHAEVSLCEVFEKGGNGGVDLAEKIVKACEQENNFHFLYETELSIKEKVQTLAYEIYGAGGVHFSPKAEKAIAEIEKLGQGNLPICIAKTQLSLSDNPTMLGRPTGFILEVKDVKISSGAGFVVVSTGDIMKMPGLPKIPSAYTIDIDDEGNITGLF